jgi:hypothetical protein
LRALSKYEWFVNDERLVDETNSVLHLRNAQPAQGGEYHVRAFNDFGSVTSQVATVTVLSAPADVGVLEP